MNILWVSHFLPYPPKGGLLQRGYYLLRELSKHATVDLLAFNQPNLIGPLLPEVSDPRAVGISELNTFCRVLAVEDVPLSGRKWGTAFIALRSLMSRYPYNINWVVSSSFASKLEEALKSKRYDIVHFDTISLAFYAGIAKRVAPTTLRSLGHHNVESHMLLRRAELAGSLPRRLYFLQEGIRLARYERRQCPTFDLNIVCSSLDGERLRSATGIRRVATIENGVDVQYFSLGQAPRDRKKLIFVGTMNWYPNVDAMRFFLKEVWPLLIAGDPQLSIDIIGANPPADLLQAATEDSRVRVHGFVDDIRPYLAGAGVYVCPIRDGGGTKLKVLDAFASGVPMVAHPVACEGIAAEDGKHVIFANQAAEFAARIRELVCDDSGRAHLSAHARELVEAHYSFDSIGRRLYEEFTAILQDARASTCAA